MGRRRRGPRRRSRIGGKGILYIILIICGLSLFSNRNTDSTKTSTSTGGARSQGLKTSVSEVLPTNAVGPTLAAAPTFAVITLDTPIPEESETMVSGQNSISPKAELEMAIPTAKPSEAPKQTSSNGSILIGSGNAYQQRPEVTPTRKPKPTGSKRQKATATPKPAKKTDPVYMSLPSSLRGDLTYQRGDSGRGVTAIQTMLVNTGFLSAGSVDGSFGGKTEEALISFQKDKRLTPTGKADAITQYYLVEANGEFSTSSDGKYMYAGLDDFVVVRFEDGIYIGELTSSHDYLKGTFIYSDGTVYAGDYHDNVRSGNGDCWYSNGDYYKGSWKNDRMDGYGVYYFLTLKGVENYLGSWVDGKMCGAGTYTFADGTSIKGVWSDNHQAGW